MNQEVKALISSLAKELDLTQTDVERAYDAPFDLMAIVMKYRCDREKQKFPSLRIPYFLIFHCPEWNKARLKRKYKKVNETI
jgi:hypothetical protein